MKEINELLTLMARLRDPQSGCPWDVEQTFSTIAPYTIEEAYEVADAIERADMEDLKAELGDLLFQVVFHARMAEEQGEFDFREVANGITQKMTKRHPHVFDPNHPPMSAEEQTKQWEKQKAKGKNSVLDGVANNLPPLTQALKLTKAAAVIGFDWPDVTQVLAKLDEEVVELKEAVASGNAEHVLDELGDVLFVCANLARHTSIDPDAALRHANHKFTRRFLEVEKQAKVRYPDQTNYSLEALDGLWEEVKKSSRRSKATR